MHTKIFNPSPFKSKYFHEYFPEEDKLSSYEYEDGLRSVEIATGWKHCGKLREASSNTLICAQGNPRGTHATLK